MNQPKFKLHNKVFKCIICNEWFDFKKEQPVIITELVAVNINQNGSAGIAVRGNFVDQKCFDKLNLEETPPPAISVPKPNFSLKDLARKR